MRIDVGLFFINSFIVNKFVYLCNVDCIKCRIL